MSHWYFGSRLSVLSDSQNSVISSSCLFCVSLLVVFLLLLLAVNALALLLVLCHDLQPRQHLWLEPEVTPSLLLDGVDCLAAWPTRLQTQVMSPKFCIDVSNEHTPINLTDRNWNFPHNHDATIVSTTEDPDVPRHSGASSSSKHIGASRVPTVFRSSGIAYGNRWRIMSRLTVVMASGKLVRIWTVKVLFQLISGLSRKGGERSKSKTLCDRLERHKISTTSLNGKLKCPSEETEWLSKNSLKLRQKLRREMGKEKFWYRFFMRSIRSSEHATASKSMGRSGSKR